MPSDTNNLVKLKSLVDKFFKLFGNIIDGYKVSESDVAKTSGGVKFSTVLKPEEGPELRIDLIATNVGLAFKDITDKIKGLTAMGIEKQQDETVDEEDYADEIADQLGDFDAASTNIYGDDKVYGAATLRSDVVKALKILLGPDCLKQIDENGDISYEGNISLDTAIKKDTGLLGIDLNTVAKKKKLNSQGFKDWKDKAFNVMRFTLICEAGNFDAGKVTNQKLTDCVKWIHKYIDVINNNGKVPEEKLEQKSRKEKLASNQNINTTALILVTPILNVIQQELRKMYQEKLNSDTSDLDKLIPGNKPRKNEKKYDEFDNKALKDSETEIQKAQQEQAQQTQQGGGPTAAKHIGITLKKIQASEELDILRLDSNYLPGDTLSDLDEIINQDEFLNTLTEEPKAFDIVVDDEGFDIEPCEDIPNSDPCASLCEVFKAGIRAYRNLYILHWMSHGNDMMKLHLMTEEMYEELQGEIDTLGELLVEKQGTVPQLDFPCDYIPVQGYDFQTGLDQIKSLIQMYIDCIDYAYCNQDSDVQSTLDEWLRYWNKQLNYFIKNQEA